MNRRILYTLLITFLCITFIGCNNQNKNNEKGEKIVSYPDRALYELKNEVKSVRWYFNNYGIEELGFELEFDSNGMASRHRYDEVWEDSETETAITRDENNRIKTYSITEKGENNTFVKAEYSYNSDGTVSVVNSTWYGDITATDIIKYDNKKNIVELVVEALSYNSHTKETIVYEYINSDENGNWTERKGIKTIEDLDGDYPILVEEGTVLERREIEYY